MPIFSLCIPTRQRTNHIERLLGTLRNTIDDISRVEVLFCCDNDDIVTPAYLENYKNRFPNLQIRIFTRERTDFLNKDYFNMLSKHAVGDFHWVMGDDVIFVHKGWDTYLCNKIEEFFKDKFDRIVYINIHDNTPLPPGVKIRYANFPLISKKAIETMGFLMPPSINSWSSDYIIHIPYLNVGRVLKVDPIILKHVSSHTNEVEADESAQRQRDFYSQYQIKEVASFWETIEVPKYTLKLNSYISSCKRYRKEM